jgi:heme-degrading monooxygenase HmoA
VRTRRLRSTFEVHLHGVALLSAEVTMYVVFWRFRPTRGRESEFERAYGPSGPWSRLFRRGDGYLGTELFRRTDGSGEYLTVDRWASRAAYEAFRARWSNEYRQLDDQVEELTEDETPLGAFEVLT